MASSGSHLSKDFLDLIKSIGDSRSKQEEDKIIGNEVEVLKIKIKESGIKPKKMKEYLLRAIYIEMLGHDAEFAQFYAVNLTQDKDLMTKRVGYLACNLLLNESSPSLIMLVSTLQKDISSKNWLEQIMALITATKFANQTIIQATLDEVYKKLDLKNEQIKKKAIVCLHRYFQVSPSSVSDIDDKMRKALCDADPSVMGATLNYFSSQAAKEPEKFKDLVSCLVVILKQIIEHKLPKEYDYHKLPAPWIQMKLLEILSYLGRDNLSASEQMYEIILQVLRRSDDTGINVGYAIVYQCLRTICLIYPNQSLLEQAALTISRFLSSDSPNLRCTGINGLSLIIQINPEYVTQHQQIIVDCLEENDETLKKNTFELLYKMTNTDNVEIIVEKMIEYLKVTDVENSGRLNILNKIIELAELYAPDKKWFIKVLNKLFVNFGGMITDEIISKLVKIIMEWSEETDSDEFKEYTIKNYNEIIKSINSLPDSLVQLISFIFGEFSYKLAESESEVENNFKTLEFLLSRTYDKEKTKSMIITAITKIHLENDFKGYEYIKDVITTYSKSKNVDIQQRALEYLRMCNNKLIKSKEYISSSMNKSFSVDSRLSFLNSYVRKKINEGAKVYNRSAYENSFHEKDKNSGELNLKPYIQAEEYRFKKDSEITTSKVSDEAKPWTTSGLREEPKIPVLFKPKEVTSVSSSSGITSIGSSNSHNKSGPTVSNNFDRVEGPKVINRNKEEKQFVPIVKKPEVKYDPKKEEKELTKKALFGGEKSNNNIVTSSNVSNIGNKKPLNLNKEANNKEIKPIQNKPNGFMDILNEGKRPAHKDIPQKEEKKEEITSGNDIFDFLLTTPSTCTVTTNTVKANENSTGIGNLEDIFSSISSTSQSQSQNQTTTNTNKPISNINNTNKSNELFSIFETPQTQHKPQTQSNLIKIKKKFEKYQIDTDTFGEFWENCPNDEVSTTISSKIKTPIEYFNRIDEIGISKIEIIDDEAIAACIYENEKFYIHSNISSNGITLLIKSLNTKLAAELSSYLKDMLK